MSRLASGTIQNESGFQFQPERTLQLPSRAAVRRKLVQMRVLSICFRWSRRALMGKFSQRLVKFRREGGVIHSTVCPTTAEVKLDDFIIRPLIRCYLRNLQGWSRTLIY
jgi:hypothetical protein